MYPWDALTIHTVFWREMMIIIKAPESKDDFKTYYALRYQVLREPWGQPKGTEKDDFEPISRHFMAVDEETGNVLGVVKWFEKESGTGQFSHLAVARDFQRQGIGHLLLEKVEKEAQAQGYSVLGAMSRLTSTAYFERHGYHITGLPTNYFGTIQVVWMEKRLD